MADSFSQPKNKPRSTPKNSHKSIQGPSVVKQAGAMGAATFLSRIGGLVREQVFAFMFGASDVADAFLIAFRIPNLLRDLFAEGAMSAAFVPRFTKVLEQSKEAAFRLLMAVLWTLLVGLTILSVLGAYFAPELVDLYATGFRVMGWKYALTVSLTRWMFPFFPMVAMAAVAMGALNAMGYFFLPAFAPALFNLASIFAGLVLCPLVAKYTTYHPIYGMALGVVLGGALQFAIQWWKLLQLGLSPHQHGPQNNYLTPWRAEGVTDVLRLIVPGTLGLAATQLGILINSIYATHQGTGAVSWLNYAFRLMQFPIGIFGVSLAAATLPRVSRVLAAKQNAAHEVKESLQLCFAINLPAAAGLMAISLPLIQLLFQHGRFQYTDSVQTAQALWFYALGLTAYSMVKILVPVYYAFGTAKVPVISSFVMVALNAALNHLFLQVLSYPFWTLALATASTVTLNALVLLFMLRKKLPGLMGADLIRSFMLSLLAAAVVYFSAWGSVRLLDTLLTTAPIKTSFVGVYTKQWPFVLWAFKVFMAMGVAGSLWLILGSVFDVPEIKRGSDLILRKLKGAQTRKGSERG
jgi:putative peptidoglycan lipid II flippase